MDYERVAMRIGDWKLVGDEALAKFQLYNVPEDMKEANDIATEMPVKTEEMKNILLDLWAGTVEEGPNEWWESDKQRSKLWEVELLG